MVSKQTEKHLWEVKFPNECELLPYEYLSLDEQKVVDKCINREQLTDDEKYQVKALLSNYMPYFKDYNIPQVEKNIEKTNKIITTQSQLLKLIHDKDNYRINMNYWINGEKYLLKMRIKPYTDKQYLEGIGTQMGIFRDLKLEERKVISKAESKQPMSPEEKNMFDAIIDKLNEKAADAEYNMKIITEFLADRIEFIDDPETTFEENVKFWEEVDLNTKTVLFHEVRGRLKLNDTFEEDLFPAVR